MKICQNRTRLFNTVYVKGERKIDALMLEGWTPILLTGIIVAIIIFFISRKTSRKTLFLTSVVLSLVCIGVVIYSKEAVGGWDGIGLAFVTVSVFLGIWVGTITGAIIKNNYVM